MKKARESIPGLFLFGFIFSFSMIRISLILRHPLLRSSGNDSSQFVYYLNLASNHGKASDCIARRSCEDACQQHLEICELMKDVSEPYDNGPGLPTK